MVAVSHKLSLDEKESLEDLLLSNQLAMKALWKEAESALSLIEARVIELSLDTNSDQINKLLILKARAEGAAQLFSALKQRLTVAPKKPRVAT